MRYLKIIFFLFVYNSFLFTPQIGFSGEKENDQLEKILGDLERKYEPGTGTQTTVGKTNNDDRSQAQINEKAQANLQVYKPPRRGAPVGRIAGGTRGILDEYPSDLCVITPDYASTTTRDQPVFYWYLRKLTGYPVEFTLIEEQAITPKLEIQIAPPMKEGLQSLDLSEYVIHLEENKVYKWFIAIVPDHERRSKDILAWSAVKYVSLPDQLRKRLSKYDEFTRVNIFAAAGIWYDAYADLSSLIEASPNNMKLRIRRDELLDQIGLNYIINDKVD